MWLQLGRWSREFPPRVEDIMHAIVSGHVASEGEHRANASQWRRRPTSLQYPAPARHEHAALTVEENITVITIFTRCWTLQHTG